MVLRTERPRGQEDRAGGVREAVGWRAARRGGWIPASAGMTVDEGDAEQLAIRSSWMARTSSMVGKLRVTEPVAWQAVCSYPRLRGTGP